jgi:hypothetical protein
MKKVGDEKDYRRDEVPRDRNGNLVIMAPTRWGKGVSLFGYPTKRQGPPASVGANFNEHDSPALGRQNGI